jgi:hypothetical protein
VLVRSDSNTRDSEGVSGLCVLDRHERRRWQRHGSDSSSGGEEASLLDSVPIGEHILISATDEAMTDR